MSNPRWFRRRNEARRGGRIWLGAVIGLVIVGGAVAAWYQYGGGFGGGESTEAAALMHTVTMDAFEHFVVERGDLESSSNEEVRCLVKAQNGTGTAILKIVPAGTFVKKGDFLIQFDDSALRTQLVQQKIVVANAAATKTQNDALLETAKAALEEYDNGTSKQEQELARGEVFVAEENLRRADEYLRFAERLAARNYITSVQLDAERFSVQKATKDLEAAKTKLEVLQKHTYQKMVAQLKGEIAKNEALLTASVAALSLESSRLASLEDQVAKCRVVAPSDGQVVYATQSERQRDEQVIIEEGAIIREGQTVIRLPDPRQMQVKALVNESRINLVRPGAAATIELDSDPGRHIDAVVESVDAFPMAKRWSSSTKEYGTVVRVLAPSENMRPGLRAKVTVFVAREANVLQAPVQSVVERDGLRFCLVKADDGWQALKVKTGANNEKYVVIQDGLESGTQIALDAQRYVGDAKFPEISDAEKLAARQPRGTTIGGTSPDGRGNGRSRRDRGREASGG